MDIFQQFYEQITNAMTANVTSTVLSLILTMLLYLAWSFFGYRAMKAFSTVFGFLLGLILGFGIVEILSLSGSWVILAPAICGLLFATAGFFVFKAGLFIAVLSFVTGAIVPYLQQIPGLNITDFWLHIIGMIVGVVAAVFCVIFVKIAIIVTSSISGGFGFAAILFTQVITIRWDSGIGSLVMIGVAFVVSIIGMIYQFRGAEGK